MSQEEIGAEWDIVIEAIVWYADLLVTHGEDKRKDI
jgi:hypothetical protein